MISNLRICMIEEFVFDCNSGGIPHKHCMDEQKDIATDIIMSNEDDGVAKYLDLMEL